MNFEELEKEAGADVVKKLTALIETHSVSVLEKIRDCLTENEDVFVNALKKLIEAHDLSFLAKKHLVDFARGSHCAILTTKLSSMIIGAECERASLNERGKNRLIAALVERIKEEVDWVVSDIKDIRTDEPIETNGPLH